MGSADTIRTILLVDIIVMSLLAVAYLRQRRMSWMAYCGWGLLALLVPVIGPFMVIAKRPGAWEPNFSFSSDASRIYSLVLRLLPVAPEEKKLPRLERVRRRKQHRLLDTRDKDLRK
jgi:hypothetical protein